ncbi:hypothetical protein F4604DRAFT_1904985 [Suillus subluteus]|nr:hypothetical protein F4604DRAFT_1904985 [Suillus subluteus]
MVAPIVNTGIQTAKYCNVAGLGVLIFDYFLTLGAEVQWTWNRRWNASNAIHIISIVAAEGLLIIRTYAFWRQNKKLLAVLLVLAVICLACAVSITEVVNSLAAPANPSDPPTSNCTFESSRSSAIQYGFLVAYELLLMSLTVFKRYQDYRYHNSHLVRTIFQGAVRYMSAIIFVSVVNILIIAVVPASYDEMMDVPQLVIHSVLASRVLFDLYESDQKKDETTLQMTTYCPT